MIHLTFSRSSVITGFLTCALLASCGGDTKTPVEKTPETPTTTEQHTTEAVEEKQAPQKIAIEITKPEVKVGSPQDILDEFKSCRKTSTKRTDCKDFTSKLIYSFYEIDDFYVLHHGDWAFLPVDKIHEKISKSSKWEKLGLANTQENLDKAKALASNNQAVLAIKNSENYSHVAVITGRKSVTSGKWNKMKVPSAMSLFQNRPEKSFIDKNLNYVFGTPEGVEIWYRKK